MSDEITVIIPYHNESDTIEYTLEQIGMQSLPAKTALFVNSSSSDLSSTVVDNWIKRNQERFTTTFKNIFEGTNNPASSKNVGIKIANTEWVAFMDCGQNFDVDWLENQMTYAKTHQLEVVSGVVYLIGENWVDRCAVAQTYGYKRNRPCLPTTLVKKSVFKRTGLLLDGRRAGYDAAWPVKLKIVGIQRGVNDAVKILYIGTNFASTLLTLFKKSVLYAKPTVRIEGYYIPWLYIIFPMLVLLATPLSPSLSMALIASYFLARIVILPIFKSRGIGYFIEHPIESILGLGLVGFVIDLGKMVGILKGIKFYYFKVKS
jgi:glycosyltransferase involved in cell wall biosynthesis